MKKTLFAFSAIVPTLLIAAGMVAYVKAQSKTAPVFLGGDPLPTCQPWPWCAFPDKGGNLQPKPTKQP